MTNATYDELRGHVEEIAAAGAIGPEHPYGSTASEFNPLAEERLSQETIDANVRRIVRWAATRSDFYQEWFHDHGVRVDDIRGQAELALIPPVDKKIIQDDQERAPPFGRL
ncbi:MAG: hypothetical protein AB7O55_28120, partial [Lautropia sp.]